MQMLSHCYELNDILENINVNSDEKSLILHEWKQLKNLMCTTNCVISPNRFIGAIQHIAKKKQRELFTGYAQNDLPEFLIFLFDCFHEGIERKVDINIVGASKSSIDELAKKCFTMIKNNYSNSYSEILQLFFGIHVSLIISNNEANEIMSITPEPFSIINLPIPHSTNNNQEFSIYDCFDLYTQSEFLEGENAWFNETTNTRESVNKCIKFWSLPNILIVDFKRFDNNNHKLNNIIETPLTRVDFSKYVLGYNNTSYVYDLFGICNHSGGSLGGHYTSYVKNANQKWYCFNDSNVTEINETSLISAKAYCYCYRKII
jgi:ubiquitin C-terminal hydrolase